ncbi:hypothetical protein HDU67_006863 [Dinochytrium kinnereticum]|nr:hypothetical protein HDU67_006863 [Dinochytrium kinnereticum]
MASAKPVISSAVPLSSKIELDFSSLLKDLQDTHNQLLSARPSSVGASDGDDHDIIGDYQGGFDGDKEGSGSDSRKGGVQYSTRSGGEKGFMERKAMYSPSDSGSGSRSESNGGDETRRERDESGDEGSVSEDSDDSYDNTPLAARRPQASPVRHNTELQDYDESRNESLARSPRPLPSRHIRHYRDESESEEEENFYARLRNPHMENVNVEEQQDEIELSDGDDESDDIELAIRYPGNAPPGKSSSGMQNVTMEDYKDDMDGLVDLLDRHIKKSRYSRMINGGDHSVAHPSHLLPTVASTLSSATHKPHTHVATMPSTILSPVKPAPTDSSDEPMDDLPLAHLQTIQRRKKSVPQALEVETPREPATPAAQNAADGDRMKMIMSKLSEANVKKITTKIYIEDAQKFETVVLTSLMTADQVVEYLLKDHNIEPSADWTLFELANDLGIERPLRDWEIVTDVIAAWDASTSVNAILMKKYGYRSTIVPKSIVGRFPKIQGYLYIETRPKKWQKKFCVLREGCIYYYKESNMTGETLICRLSGFDVYTLSRDKKKTPTQFCFALRSTSNIIIFENKVDYVHFICVDRQDRLYDWVLAIRLAKNELTFQEFPELFDDYEHVPARDRLGSQAQKDGKDKGANSDAISPGTLKRRQQAAGGSGAGVTSPPPQSFVPVNNTLLGRSTSAKDRPIPVVKAAEERPPIEAPAAAAVPIIPQKPLLSFANSAINYQERDKKGPKVAQARRKVEKERPREPSSSQHRNRPAVGESERDKEDREEKERIQMMDDMWVQEQAQMERFIEDERRRLANGGEAEPEPETPRRRRDDAQRERRNRSKPPPEEERKHRSDSSRRRKAEGAPSSSKKEKGGLERRGSAKEHRERDKDLDRPSPAGDGSGRVGTLGRSKTRPLVDVSSANNCLTCGCSEFKTSYGSRADMCNNW